MSLNQPAAKNQSLGSFCKVMLAKCKEQDPDIIFCPSCLQLLHLLHYTFSPFICYFSFIYSPSFSLKFRIQPSLHIEIKMQLNKLSKTWNALTLSSDVFFFIKEKNINKNSRQKLHSAAFVNNSILWFAGPCVRVPTTAAFGSPLYFGTG